MNSSNTTRCGMAHTVCGFILAVARQWMANMYVHSMSFTHPGRSFPICIELGRPPGLNMG